MPADVRYELHRDELEDTYEVRRIEVVETFDSREAARQFMIDTTAARQLRDEGAAALGFNDLMVVAQQLLDAHYPADVPLVCHRDSPDPGARLTAALRDCMEAMARA